MNDSQRTTVVVVGHVDHGKSTLLGRLLMETGHMSQEKIADIEKASTEQGRRFEYAFLTDQFHEERSANVTIDTAQVFIDLKDRPFLIIDAPGHKEFLKNMISGTSYAKNALLMLDVKEGIREQTERHAQILRFMGIDRIAVIINKMDLVDYDRNVFDQKKSELESVLASHNVSPTAIIPASSYFGENVTKPSDKMTWYAGPTVLDFFLGCTADTVFPSKGPFCLPVQLNYQHDGNPVALGRIEQGTARPGDRIQIFPGDQKGTIDKIFRYPSAVSQAEAGASVGLKVSGVSSFSRGQVILSPDIATKASEEIVCQLLWASGETLKNGDAVLVECRSQKAKGRVTSMVGDSGETLSRLENGDMATVKVNLEEKIFLSVPKEIPALSKVVVHHDNTLAGCAIVSKIMVVLLLISAFSGTANAYIDPGTGVTFATGFLGWVIGLLTLAAGGGLLLIKKSWGKIKSQAQKLFKFCGF